jgi:hypothetical protein
VPSRPNARTGWANHSTRCMACLVERPLLPGDLHMVGPDEIARYPLDYLEQRAEVAWCRDVVAVKKAEITSTCRRQASISGGRNSGISGELDEVAARQPPRTVGKDGGGASSAPDPPSTSPRKLVSTTTATWLPPSRAAV